MIRGLVYAPSASKISGKPENKDGSNSELNLEVTSIPVGGGGFGT